MKNNREYLLLEYAPSKRGFPGDKLYVPTDQLDLLTRYVGGEAPPLSKMGGSDWAAAKGRARKAVRDIASSWSSSTRPGWPARATRSRRTPRGSASWRRRSRSWRRPTSSPPSTRSRPTWSGRSRWTASSPATSATARPRSPSARRSRPFRTASRSSMLVPTTLLVRAAHGDLRGALRRIPGPPARAQPIPDRQGVQGDDRRPGRRQRRHRHRHAPAALRQHRVQGPRPRRSSTRSSASASSTRMP